MRSKEERDLELIYERSQMFQGFEEGLNRNGQYRLQRLIAERGVETASSELVNHFLKQLGQIDDPQQLGTSPEHSEGIIKVSSFLQAERFGDAVKTAKETANFIINTDKSTKSL